MENHAKVSCYPRDIPRSMPKSVGNARTPMTRKALGILSVLAGAVRHSYSPHEAGQDVLLPKSRKILVGVTHLIYLCDCRNGSEFICFVGQGLGRVVFDYCLPVMHIPTGNARH
jgi:hypothetical protein